jgi:hypothetical protein
MSFKCNMSKAEIALAELRTAIAEAKLASGESQMILVHDPEDPATLAPYKGDLYQSVSCEIGPPEFHGRD